MCLLWFQSLPYGLPFSIHCCIHITLYLTSYQRQPIVYTKFCQIKSFQQPTCCVSSFSAHYFSAIILYRRSLDTFYHVVKFITCTFNHTNNVFPGNFTACVRYKVVPGNKASLSLLNTHCHGLEINQVSLWTQAQHIWHVCIKRC